MSLFVSGNRCGLQNIVMPPPQSTHMLHLGVAEFMHSFMLCFQVHFSLTFECVEAIIHVTAL